ncbi:MAG: GNAT family N-acetyltransferase [Clostridia bacterium]|nr:GNAT family N-acetyltransferase [Clostridia bacterium]
MNKNLDFFKEENILVRDVKKEDLHAVSEINVNGWKTAYRGIMDDSLLDSLSIDENYQRRLNDYMKNFFVVAEIENEVVGFCRFQKGNNYKERFPEIDCEINALYVKPEYKRNGIGRKIVNYVINELKNDGCSKMIIWCLKYNYPSRNFYEKMGGKYCGEKSFEKADKAYKEAGFLYDLSKLPKEEIILVEPEEKYKEQVMNYRKVFLDENESMDGCAGLQDCESYEEWANFEKRLKKKHGEGYVPSDVFLAIRKKDDKLVGMIDLRKGLTDFLYNFGGNIGYSVLPTERRKGYATEMLKQLLPKCKAMKINRVLITCDKENMGSSKTIISNGGVLENEVNDEVGLSKSGTVQRYWISLKKRYADMFNSEKAKAKLKVNSVEEEFFKGDIYFYDFNEVKKKILLPNGKTLIDVNYKWLEFYDYSSKVKLTAVYDENNEIFEWYFDIARKIGKEKGIPYEDDLYLDVVLRPDGEIILLDEDELEEAYNKKQVTKEEYNNAYKEAEKLMENLKNNKEKLEKYTDKCLHVFRDT